MVKKKSRVHKNKQVIFDGNGLHFTELLELALDEPEQFEFLLKCFELDIDNDSMLKLIEQII